MRWIVAVLIGVVMLPSFSSAFANHFSPPFEYLNGTEPTGRIACSGIAGESIAEITCEYPYDHDTDIQYTVVRRGEVIAYVLRRARGAKSEVPYNAVNGKESRARSQYQ